MSAYERRIGDWSSTGCSSDLLNNPTQWVLGDAAAPRPSGLLAVADLFTLSGSVGHRVIECLFSREDALSMSDEALLRWIPAVLEEIVLSEAAIFLLPEHRARLRHQIGRASCRERVCPYV